MLKEFEQEMAARALRDVHYNGAPCTPESWLIQKHIWLRDLSDLVARLEKFGLHITRIKPK